MPDYSRTRSEYLKIMMGQSENYGPQNINDVGGTSYDAASLSQEEAQLKADYNSKKQSAATSTGYQSAGTVSSNDDQNWIQQTSDVLTTVQHSLAEGFFDAIDAVGDFFFSLIGGISGGFWGAENDVTKAMEDVVSYDWVSYATRAAYIFNPYDEGFWTNEGGYWTDWSLENTQRILNDEADGIEWLRKTGNFVGYAIPSVVLAAATGGQSIGVQVAAQAGFGLVSGYGSGVESALNSGASLQEASAYGAIEGGVNAVFSAAGAYLGGINASATAQTPTRMISEAMGKAVTDRFGQTAGMIANKATKIVVSAIGEASEAAVQQALEPAFQLTYDENAWYNAYGTKENREAYGKQILESALIAAAGSAAIGIGREVQQYANLGAEGYRAEYESELIRSANYKKLRSYDRENGTNYHTRYSQAASEWMSIQAEDARIQQTLDDMAASGYSQSVIDAKADEFFRMQTSRRESFTRRYGKFYQDATDALNSMDQPKSSSGAVATVGEAPEASASGTGAGPSPDVSPSLPATLSDVSVANIIDSQGRNIVAYTPTNASSLKVALTGASTGQADSKVVKLPISASVSREEVLVDASKLTSAEIETISNLKPADIKDRSGVKFAKVSDSKILVIGGGETGIYEAAPRQGDAAPVFNVGGTEITLTSPDEAKSQIEAKYGKDVSKTKPSLVIEAANAKEGKTFTYKSTLDLATAIDEAVRSIVESDSVPGQSFKVDLSKGDLTKQVFSQLNLSKSQDKQAVREYIEGYLLDTKVRYTDESGAKETYSLRDLVDSDEQGELSKAIDDAFDEIMKGGKTSRLSAISNELNDRISRLIGENDRIRVRAKLAAQSAKDFNALANKLGLNGKPSQVKTILKNASEADIGMIDMFREIVKNTKISSKTGLSVSPKSAQRLADFNANYTYERFGGSSLWDTEIKKELQSIYDLSEDGKFKKYAELDVEVQQHIDNLLKAINHKLTKEVQAAYQRNVDAAKESASLLRFIAPKSRAKIVSAIGSAAESAENLPTYLAIHLGEENPAYQAIVDGWAKASGLKASAKQRYAQKLNSILEEEGLKPSKGLNFLRKKVEFKGYRVTKGEAASMYFSALTKEGIAKGENELVIYNDKTRSYSKKIRLADGDLPKLKSTLTSKEFRVLDRIQKELLNDVMTKDYVEVFKQKHGYTPETSSDYFALNAHSTRADISAEQAAFGANYTMGSTWGRERSRQTYKGAYRVYDFRSQLAQYSNDLAQYIGYADYDESIRVLFNTKIQFGDGKESFGDLLSEKLPNWSSSKKNGGKSWFNYFKIIATDSNVNDSGRGILATLHRASQISVLGLNISTMGKQFASDFTVMGRVGSKTWLASKKRVPYNLSHYKNVRNFLTNSDKYVDTTDPDYAEYEPYFALIRERFDNEGAIRGELSTNALDNITGKIAKFTLKPMGWTDEANNVINVWSVAETMAKENDGLAYGTNANRLQALKYFVDLVLTTQSNSNKLYMSMVRSGYSGQINRLLFGMFASDNQNKLQLFDMATRASAAAKSRAKQYEKVMNDVNASDEERTFAKQAYDKARSNYSAKNTSKRIAGWVAGMVLSGLFVAGMNEFFSRLKATGDKTLTKGKLDPVEFAGDAVMEAFVNWIPYISTFVSAIEYNSTPSVMGVETVYELFGNVSAFMKALQSGDSSRIGGAFTKLALSMSDATGLPLNNIYKYIRGLVKNVSGPAYVSAFSWLDGLTSSEITSYYNDAVETKDSQGAMEILSMSSYLYKTGKMSDSLLKETVRLGEEGFDAIARNVPTSYEDEEGATVELSSEQSSDFYEQYVKATSAVESMIKKVAYSNLEDQSKARAIKKAYNAYYEAARYKALQIDPTSKLGMLLAYSNGNIDIASTILMIQQQSEILATAAKTKKEQSVALVNRQSSMSRPQRLLALYLMGYSLSDDNEKAVKTYLRSIGFSEEEADKLVS